MPFNLPIKDAITYLERVMVNNKARGMIAEIEIIAAVAG